jgi:hypothetical protein
MKVLKAIRGGLQRLHDLLVQTGAQVNDVKTELSDLKHTTELLKQSTADRLTAQDTALASLDHRVTEQGAELRQMLARWREIENGRKPSIQENNP